MWANKPRLERGRVMPLLALFATAALWSLGGVAFKPLHWQAGESTDWLVASWRSLFAAIAFFAFWWRSGGATGGSVLPKMSWQIFRPSLAYAGLVLTFVVSTRWTSTAEATFLMSSAPQFAALLLWGWYREKQETRDLQAVAVAAAGLALLFLNQAWWHGQGSLLGNVVATSAGLLFAMYCIAPKQQSDRLPILFWGNVVASLPAAFGIIHGLLPPVDVAASLAVYAVLTTVIPFLLFTWAQPQCGALSSLLLLNLEPVLATTWSVLFFGEHLNPMLSIGCVLVMAASFHSAGLMELVKHRSPAVG